MILDAIISFFDWLISHTLGNLPGDPSWLPGVGAHGATILQGVIDTAAKWGFVVPFETLQVVFPIALGSFVVAIVIRVLRIALSYLTLGGGM